ncbi:ABC transporter permease [Solwaraspora sp. WMMD791]|uniref:ABC transporter permease n=1 Tax=Solwaraspora sp. WMMD791 TaxID=3016086 RepID=UPI00249C2DB4|nr:ABC transporter permease [Solwaraspora sp. WMMD791]WFE27708.1 ABC transporter permease [Solwaraspora sp. WMMD791]
MSALGRRLRAYAGHIALLAALGMVAATMVTAVPRAANTAVDQALRPHLSAMPHLARDLVLTERPTIAPGPGIVTPPVDSAAGQRRTGTLRDELPQPVPQLVGSAWYAAAIGPDGVDALGDAPPFRRNPPPVFGLRAQTGVREASRLVAGAWPASPGDTGAAGDAAPTQITMSRQAAETLSLRIGDVLRISGGAGNNTARLELVGLFEPLDAADPVWDDLTYALAPLRPVLDRDPWYVAAVTDWTGLDAAARTLGIVRYEWRYRIATDRIDATHTGPLASAAAAARRTPPDGTTLTSSLDTVLADFDGQVRAARALLAIVGAGLFACVFGLIWLAAGLQLRRRADELSLLRARGAAVTALGRYVLVESVVVAPAAVVAGWLLGSAVPGRPGASELPLLLVVAAVTTAAVPALLTVRTVVAAAGTVRRGGTPSAVGADRGDLARRRSSPGRLTAELSVVLVAVGGLWLLRRRGLAADDGVDPFLVSVPVLLAVGAALVTLRTLPWPLRQLDRLAARARGAVFFLGLARAGRGAPVTPGPLAVLVTAVSVGLFSAVVATTITDTRDRVSDREVAGDAVVTGFGFAVGTGDELAALPGVAAVAPAVLATNRQLVAAVGTSAQELGQAQVLVVDVPALAEVAEVSGVRLDLPAVLRDAVADPAGGPVPAVVSPDIARLLAEDLPDGTTEVLVDVQGRRHGFSVAAVADGFAGLPVDARGFVVLPMQALTVPPYQPVVPQRYLLAGDGFDPAAVVALADAGQRQRIAEVAGSAPDDLPQPATLTTWSAHRQALERTGANELLTLVFTLGTVGAVVLALVTVGLAVLAGSTARGRALSRLRTMGLSRRQGQLLLVYELVPVVGAAVVAGGAVGVVLPRLLDPALGLAAFTAGVAAPPRFDPVVIIGVLASVTVGLAAALTTDDLVHRSTRLGRVLRVGGDDR